MLYCVLKNYVCTVFIYLILKAKLEIKILLLFLPSASLRYLEISSSPGGSQILLKCSLYQLEQLFAPGDSNPYHGGDEMQINEALSPNYNF